MATRTYRRNDCGLVKCPSPVPAQDNVRKEAARPPARFSMLPDGVDVMSLVSAIQTPGLQASLTGQEGEQFQRQRIEL